MIDATSGAARRPYDLRLDLRVPSEAVLSEQLQSLGHRRMKSVAMSLCVIGFRKMVTAQAAARPPANRSHVADDLDANNA